MPLSYKKQPDSFQNDEFSRALASAYTPFDQVRDLSPLIDRIKDARVVMLGEASHGTQEFYLWRRLLTQWLITKHGFNFVAVEGDWPDVMKIHRYVTEGEGHEARSVLGEFRRWPTWMWANTEVIRMMEWMRTHNTTVDGDRRAGFFGLDVYSLFESIDAVITYLEKNHPFLARRARHRYGCFDRFHRDGVTYARSLFRFPEGCEAEVVEMLEELLRVRLSGLTDDDALFDAQQNARIISNAESYYRAMVHLQENSWNVRDQHMMETLNILMNRYDERLGEGAKCIVWAHNTHIGDYRATDMARDGMINIGGLAREEYGPDQVALVGFSTYQGEVIAAHAWDGPTQIMEVPAAREGSLEAHLHRVCAEQKSSQGYLLFDEGDENGPLGEVRDHRAIGVVYDPDQEKRGNYVPTRLPARYDAMIYLDQTCALEPLITSYNTEDIPETWPTGQ